MGNGRSSRLFQTKLARDDLKKSHDLHCADTDQPLAALLDDLKATGLLDTTLVIRGGGIRGGVIHGATDEFGNNAIEKPISVPDLHATILHQLGLDHEQLTYRNTGRDYRLTDVSGAVVREILA